MTPNATLPLTPRQAQVARLVSQGLTDKELASALHLSYPTIKLYLQRIYRRLDIHNRTQLAVWWLTQKGALCYDDSH